MNKKSTLFLLVSAALIFAGTSIGQAQNVTYTNHSDLLNNMTGFGTNNCTVDMNGDFLDDVVRVTGSGLYIDFQQEDGSFSQTYFPVNFQNSPSWSICAGDLDNNGFNDLLFGGGQL